MENSVNRFEEIVSLEKIKDTVTGRYYHGLIDDDLLNLINRISYRADRNAELIDMDKTVLEHQLMETKQLNKIYLHTVKRVNEILQKYEIDDLEKLDRILFEQKVW